jgi:hypothetical protein
LGKQRGASKLGKQRGASKLGKQRGASKLGKQRGASKLGKQDTTFLFFLTGKVSKYELFLIFKDYFISVPPPHPLALVNK